MKQYTKDLGRVSLVPNGMWDIEKSYDRLSLVYHSGNKFAYVAKQDVPANTSIDNKEYWQPMNITGYADNNFINLSIIAKDGTITVYDNIEEAIKTVASDIRKPGAVLSFYNTNEGSLDILPEYELWQFNSTDVNDWENPDCWNNIYFNKNVFVGWYINENILYKYQSTPSVGQYAYVGVDFYTSLLYQCRANGVWTNTNTTIGDFISIIVKGNVEVGPNGNWWNNGVDTGFPASVDSEVVINKVVNNVLEKLKDGITTDKVTTNTIEAEEIDEEKNLNIIADKIISDAEIIIGNSIINNNEIKADKISLNDKTSDDILLGDGSTTSLSEIKEAYLPLNIPEGGKVITLADDNGIKIVKNNDTAYNIIRNKYINMYGESSAGGLKIKFNRSINKVNDIIYGYIDKDVDGNYNLEINRGLRTTPSISDLIKRKFDDGSYSQKSRRINLSKKSSDLLYDTNYYNEGNGNSTGFAGRIYNNDSEYGNAVEYFISRLFNNYRMGCTMESYDNRSRISNAVVDGDLEHNFQTRIYNTGKNFTQIGTYNSSLDKWLNGSILIETDCTKEQGGIAIVGKTSNDVLGAAYNTLHIGPDDGTTSYSNIAPIVYNETDKKWYIPEEFIKDTVSGKYLPLSGGDMDETASINMPDGSITINNTEENASVIHNGMQSTYKYSINGKLYTFDVDGTGFTASKTNSTSEDIYSKITISASDITFVGTYYKTIINDEDGIEVRSLANDYYSAIHGGQITICNNNGNSSTFDTTGLSISLTDNTSATLTDTELNLNDNAVLNANGLTLPAAKLTNALLTIGNDATTLDVNQLEFENDVAHISKTDIKLNNGNTTLNNEALTLSGGAGYIGTSKIELAAGNVKLNNNELIIGGGAGSFTPGGVTFGDGSKVSVDRLEFANGGHIFLNKGKASHSTYSISWDGNFVRYINAAQGITLHSDSIYMQLADSSNIGSNGKIITNSLIGGFTNDAFVDFDGTNNSFNKLIGLYFSSSKAFTVKGITIHNTTNDNYKNAILRNMPSTNDFSDWDDKYQYTIGPKDTSFDTEYEAVAPLVQDTTDPSKWTIPSEYLPDTDTKKDSVELYIPKFIESVKGQQIDLYFDNVSSELNEFNSYPTQVRTLGSDSTLVKIEKNHYRFNPSQSDAIFVEKYDNTSEHNTLLTKSFTNVVTSNNPTGLTKNICIMGDGFVSETYMMAEIKKLFDAAVLGTINLIGTKTTTIDNVTYTHEGRKDWDWTHYLDTSYESKTYSGSTNAFVVDGEINFQKYMSKYFSALTQNIDYFVICMGTKEVMYGVSDDIIASVIENTKQFVDILLSSDKGFPECKIAILLQPVGPYNSNNGNINVDIYQSSINKLNKALIEAFDAGNYNTHTTVSGANLFINRYDGYDYKDINVDEYSSRTVRQYKNLPYLSEIGSRQYGKGVYNKLRAFIDGNL